MSVLVRDGVLLDPFSDEAILGVILSSNGKAVLKRDMLGGLSTRLGLLHQVQSGAVSRLLLVLVVDFNRSQKLWRESFPYEQAKDVCCV